MKPLILAIPLLLTPSAWAELINIPDSLPEGCPASADTEHPQRVADYLASGWEIRGVASGPKETLVLQKGDQAVICEMAGHVTIKGVDQVMTASCAVVR